MVPLIGLRLVISSIVHNSITLCFANVANLASRVCRKRNCIFARRRPVKMWRSKSALHPVWRHTFISSSSVNWYRTRENKVQKGRSSGRSVPDSRESAGKKKKRSEHCQSRSLHFLATVPFSWVLLVIFLQVLYHGECASCAGACSRISLTRKKKKKTFLRKQMGSSAYMNALCH